MLVRHGESEPLVEGSSFPLVDGHGDPALAPEGRAQAELVGERLSTEPIEAIYVTTLRRTQETAAPLAARLGLTPIVEADLREVHLGDWEGELFRQKVADGDPIVVQMFTEQRWDAIPGAEKAEVFGARVKAGIDRIAAAHPDQRVRGRRARRRDRRGAGPGHRVAAVGLRRRGQRLHLPTRGHPRPLGAPRVQRHGPPRPGLGISGGCRCSCRRRGGGRPRPPRRGRPGRASARAASGTCCAPCGRARPARRRSSRPPDR